MLKFGNREFRNLQEQVLKNMQNIANLKEGTAVLSEFGIKVVGEVDSLQDLPSVIDYKTAHEDWEYGDAFAIGTQPPYTLVILTRANDEITADHWFDIGDFPAPGPQGAAGPQGEVGPQGQTGDQGPAGVDAGFGSVLATAQTLPAGSPATVTVTASGPNTAKEFSFVFGLPRGADGGNPVWGNIQGTLSDQTDLDNALDAKQDTLVSGTNIKTINNQSVVGSGNIEINSGVWGNITGTLSDQTDLANALAEKQPVIDASHKLSASYVSGLADVATTGAYSDLSGRPTIGEGTITIKKNNETIDSFTLNQTASQNINIVVPTKTSDITNDSDFTTKTYVDGQLALKQDVISDLSTIRSGAEAGATAVQPADIADMATETWVGQQDYATNTALTNGLAGKEDVISDLSTIRSGAAAGATAVQPAGLSTALSEYTKTSGLASVALSGSYNDLSNKPTIPTVNNATLTIQKNGTQVGTFTANASSNKTINITVPTNSDYVDLTSAQTITGVKTLSAQLNTNSIIPNASNTYNLGSNEGNRWGHVYANTFEGSRANVNTVEVYDDDAGILMGYNSTNSNPYIYLSRNYDTNSTLTNSELLMVDDDSSIKLTANSLFLVKDNDDSPRYYGCAQLELYETSDATRDYEHLRVKLGDGSTISGSTNVYTLLFPFQKSGTLAITSDIPTNNNQLTNGAGYQTASDVSTAIAGQTKETWTFTLQDGTTVTKTIVLG